jgi:hypothetical protein
MIARAWTLRGAGAAAVLMAGAAALLSQNGPAPQSGPFPPMILADVPADDAILRAMRDEMDRSRQLRIAGAGDAPYFFSYSITDADNVTVSASLGAVYNISRTRFRAPAIEVRVGSYEFDQTGHIFSGIYSGSRYDQSWPLDNDYGALRQSFWLATDVAYKAALESMARKRASMNSAAATAEKLPDFSKAPPVVSIARIVPVKIDEQALAARAARLSAVFRAFPETLTSAVEIHSIQDTTYLLNSEGAAVRYPDNLSWVYGKAEGQAPDGMLVHDAVTFQSNDLGKLPSDAEIEKGLAAVAGNVRALTSAPPGEAFSGPVLFEPLAAAQLLAQLIGDNLRVPRRPLADPGRPVNYQPSELEGRIGARVLPEWMDAVDDATQTVWSGKPLVGAYDFDLEGVAPQPVSLIEKGMLRNFLTTRQPIRGFPGSNGHARLGGSFGARSAAVGNLFIRASETSPLAELKQKLIGMIGDRNKPYGMLVRKLDYPFSGSNAELQALAGATAQAGGGRLVSPPVLVYRVYSDGREELVRGLRFRGVSARSLRDILAASREPELFEWVNSGAPLAMLGGGGYLAGTSVVAPGLLFDELELEPPREPLPRRPIVSPPPRDAR